MSQENNYHISFFQPTTARAKYNRNMVVWLISIWAVAIFGFHFLLKAIEKPTPEPELLVFNEVWENVKKGNASNEELLKFAQATLHVSGKVFIKTHHRAALDNGITWATFQLADSSQKVAINESLLKFEAAAKSASAVTDRDYIEAKLELGAMAQQVLQLNPANVLAKILPLELRSSGMLEFTEANKATVEACMPLYTIHNQSVLTDTKFLGFPFHYFYTAVFLLVLFIGLCWAYCYKVDKYNASIGLAE
jgi:putative solute:sodium symporter small subunit